MKNKGLKRDQEIRETGVLFKIINVINGMLQTKNDHLSKYILVIMYFMSHDKYTTARSIANCLVELSTLTKLPMPKVMIEAEIIYETSIKKAENRILRKVMKILGDYKRKNQLTEQVSFMGRPDEMESKICNAFGEVLGYDNIPIGTNVAWRLTEKGRKKAEKIIIRYYYT